jgi:hypothetical protein
MAWCGGMVKAVAGVAFYSARKYFTVVFKVAFGFAALL